MVYPFIRIEVSKKSPDSRDLSIDSVISLWWRRTIFLPPSAVVVKRATINTLQLGITTIEEFPQPPQMNSLDSVGLLSDAFFGVTTNPFLLFF